MNEKEEFKNQVIKIIKEEIDERRRKSGLIVDRIDSEALIKVPNEVLKLT